MAYKGTFSLQPQPPFSFDLTAHIFSSGDGQIRSYRNGVFHQVLEVGGNLVLVKMASEGTVEQPRLRVQLESNQPVTGKEKLEAQQAVAYIFNLGFDLRSFYREVKADHAMQQITHQLYGLKNPTTPTVFESLVDSIWSSKSP